LLRNQLQTNKQTPKSLHESTDKYNNTRNVWNNTLKRLCSTVDSRMFRPLPFQMNQLQSCSDELYGCMSGYTFKKENQKRYYNWKNSKETSIKAFTGPVSDVQLYIRPCFLNINE